MNIKLIISISIFVILSSCKSSESAVEAADPETKATFEILLMGNSHSSSNNLPGMLATLIQTGTSESVTTVNAPGFKFLDERLTDGVSEKLLKSREWTHVILQAQKYSTSGLYHYSTEPSKEWIRKAKQQAATPIMFPEWPRKGNFEEGVRIHALHESIVAAEPACLAPIGLAWDQVILSHPTLNLHNPDGNHSNKSGALLTAYVLYEVISKNKASDLPIIDSLGVAQSTQEILKSTASEVVELHPPCSYF